MGSQPETVEENGSDLCSQYKNDQGVESDYAVTSENARTDHHTQQNKPNPTPILYSNIMLIVLVFHILQINFIAKSERIFDLARALLEDYFRVAEQLSLKRVILDVPLVRTIESKFQIMVLHDLWLFFRCFEKHNTNIFRTTKHQIRIVSVEEDYVL